MKRANPDFLDKVYSDLPDRLKLDPKHRENLCQRGLTDQEIDQRGYKTLPPHGRDSTALLMWHRHGDSVLSVPGFFAKQKVRGAKLAESSGLLIPVRDLQGRIVALKVRSDTTDAADRYTYLSSTKHRGPSPGSPVHVPLGITAPAEVVRLTEGELKSDVAATLSKISTISAPGVASWKSAIEVLKSLKAQNVRLAFDSDASTKPQVAQALRNYWTSLCDAGFNVELERWDSQHGKGIDDLLADGSTPQVLRGSDVRKATKKLSKPQKLIRSAFFIQRDKRT